jgi:hypothetical protein
MVPKPVTRSRSVAVSFLASLVLASCAGKVVGRAPGSAPLLFVEVSDSVGLPLPDARLELFDRADRGLNREWLPIAPEMLEEGIHLLRFSHPGYRSSTFSVPLREGGLVTLRVRLAPDSGQVAPRKGRPTAKQVRATGIARHGNDATDIIADRLVLDRADIENADAPTIADVLREARETGLVVEDTPGGLHTVRQISRGRVQCPVQVVINGEERLVISFLRFEELYRFSEAEAIEILPRETALPFYFHRSEDHCGFLLLWLTGRQG